MKLETIINKFESILNPFSLKELILAGAIALSVGTGTGYVIYNNIPVKEKVEQIEVKKPINLNQTNYNTIATINNNPVKKVKKTGRPKIFINRQPVSGNQININYGQKIRNQNVSCRAPEQYKPRRIAPQTPARYQPRRIAQPIYQPSNITPQINATPEIRVTQPNATPEIRVTQTNATPENKILQTRTEGRKDGYNLTARFFPQGIRSRSQGVAAESMDLVYGVEEEDYAKTSLHLFRPGQYILIQPDDFSQESFLSDLELMHDGMNVKNYFNISNNGKHIFITPILDILNGGSLKISIPVKNKYGTIEYETLEVIIDDRQ